MGGFLTGMIAILAGACDDTGYPRVCWRGVTRLLTRATPGHGDSSLAHHHHSHPWIIIIITGS